MRSQIPCIVAMLAKWVLPSCRTACTLLRNSSSTYPPNSLTQKLGGHQQPHACCRQVPIAPTASGDSKTSNVSKTYASKAIDRAPKLALSLHRIFEGRGVRAERSTLRAAFVNAIVGLVSPEPNHVLSYLARLVEQTGNDTSTQLSHAACCCWATCAGVEGKYW